MTHEVVSFVYDRYLFDNVNFNSIASMPKQAHFGTVSKTKAPITTKISAAVVGAGIYRVRIEKQS